MLTPRNSKEKSDSLFEHKLITRVHNQRRCYHLLLVEFNIFLGRSVYHEEITVNTIISACIHAHNSQLSRARNIFRKETPIEQCSSDCWVQLSFAVKMGRRKKAAKKVAKKKKAGVARTFKCLFCNHEDVVSCRLDMKSMTGATISILILPPFDQ